MPVFGRFLSTKARPRRSLVCSESGPGEGDQKREHLLLRLPRNIYQGGHDNRADGSGQTREVVLEVAADGSLRQGDKAISPSDVLRMLHREEPEMGAIRVVLRVGANISNNVAETSVESLVRGGVGRSLIEIRWNR